MIDAVSRLTPPARPAGQPRPESTACPRALADEGDGLGCTGREAGLVVCAAQAAAPLPQTSSR
eukprot:scaffold63843_cov65-Phaeocystis_antarctica.AAC.2